MRAAYQAMIAVAATALLGACGGTSDQTAETAAPPRPRTTARPPAPAPPARRMTHAGALRALRGARVVVGDREVALDPATLTCAGVGPARKRGRALTWARFRCVQPTFPPGATVGPDVVFVAEAAPSGRRMRVSGARLTAY